MRLLFFDTETTGLNPGQIGQLSFIVENNCILETTRNYYFNVENVEPGAQAAHGLSKEDFAQRSCGLTFKDVYTEVYNYFTNSKIVAHNLAFDEKFISSELWRLGISYKPADRRCTMQFFTPIVKIPAKNTKYGQYKYPKLEELVDFYGIKKDKILLYSRKLFGEYESGFHDSRYDTTAMYIAVNIYRETLQGKSDWKSVFCT